MTRPLNSIEACALNEGRASLTADGTMIHPLPTVSLVKHLDICANCGRDCAPTPSIEVDPLCSGCIADFRACDINIPLPALHDLWFALQAPAITMPTNYDDYDRPQSPRPLWW